MSLKISNIFRQNNELITKIDAPINVTNISKRGIGFETQASLPVGYYFNAKINLGNNLSSLYTVVQIVRVEPCEDHMYYGWELMGLAPILDFVFEDFNPGSDEE